MVAGTTIKVLDSDTHLYEGRHMWSEYAEPSKRHRALRIEDDELGHAWLMLDDRRIHVAEVHTPGRVDQMGDYHRRVLEG